MVLLSNLLPGEFVLADRGLDIKVDVALYCAEIKIPSFTKGKKQLLQWDTESTRRIANVKYMSNV